MTALFRMRDVVKHYRPARGMVHAVDGGDLHAGRWGRGAEGPVVLAVHGVTANHRCWAEVASRSGCTVMPSSRTSSVWESSAPIGMVRSNNACRIA